MNKKKGIIASSALTVAFLLALGSSESEQAVKVDKSTEETKTEQAEKAEKVENTEKEVSKVSQENFKIGERVKLDNLEITVNNVDVAKGNRFAEPKEGNKFIVVDVTLVNEGFKPEKISSLLMFKLYGEDSYEKEESIFVETKGNLNGELAPGRTMRGQLAYEVGEEETKWDLIFQADLLKKGQAIFDVEENQFP